MHFVRICHWMKPRGIALFPFILFKEKSFAADPVMVNHELIHLRQELELLIVPFYIFYLFNYCINRFRYSSHHEAYLNIIFEREAYSNEGDEGYLKRRRPFSFLKYF